MMMIATIPYHSLAGKSGRIIGWLKGISFHKIQNIGAKFIHSMDLIECDKEGDNDPSFLQMSQSVNYHSTSEKMNVLNAPQLIFEKFLPEHQFPLAD